MRFLETTHAFTPTTINSKGRTMKNFVLACIVALVVLTGVGSSAEDTKFYVCTGHDSSTSTLYLANIFQQAGSQTVATAETNAFKTFILSTYNANQYHLTTFCEAYDSSDEAQTSRNNRMGGSARIVNTNWNGV